MDKVNITSKLSHFQDHWNPRIIGELNGQHVKVAKFKGEFVWHSHENEDELFYVIKGELTIRFRDRVEVLTPGEFIIVPRGVEHKPECKDEVEVMLFEPASTINTGSTDSDLTRTDLDKI
jgi:mannose-6-phosphate isomerase-like protein (cupin superfamily)